MRGEFVFPGQLIALEAELKNQFLHYVEYVPEGERIKQCLQCGTCTGSCPVSYAMDITPREIIALFRAGQIQKILNSESIWLCVSCYSCQTRCPQQIRLTDIFYVLKQLAIKNKIYSRTLKVHKLRETFLTMLNKYGRLNETLLMIKFLLKTNPLKGFVFLPMAIKLILKGRLSFRNQEIKSKNDLKLIIKKSKEILLPVEKFSPTYEEEAVGYKAIT
jgi:heterodisulfide reductase subunit C